MRSGKTKKLSAAALSIALIFVCTDARAFLDHGTDTQPSQSEEAEAAATKKCTTGDYQCETERKISNIKQDVGSVTDPFAKDPFSDENFWTWWFDRTPREKKTKYGLKALKLAAYTPNYLVRAFTWPIATSVKWLISKGVIETFVNTFSNKERTFWVYPLVELGFGSGFGGGVGVRHLDMFNRDYKFSANYKIHVNLDQSAMMTFGKPDAAMIASMPLSYSTAVKWLRYWAGNYYGIGFDTPQSNHGIFSMDNVTSGGNASYKFVGNLGLFGIMNLSVDWSGSGNGTFPSVETFMPPNQIRGFEKYLMYLVPGLRFDYDSRGNKLVSESGGHHYLMVQRFQGLNRQDYDYLEYELQALQYIKLWMARHVLVLRMNWIFQQPTGDKIPFYRLAALDVNSPARGFSAGRFHDNARVVYNAEYKFPVWNFIDGEIFFDTGRVYSGPTDVSFKHMAYSGGGGLLIRTRNYFLGRFEVGYGGEGVKILFSTNQAF